MTISAVVWYDVAYRYSRQQHLINRILPPSRTNNRYCNPINVNNFDNLHANNATIEGLKNLTRGKFSTINFETWSRGTVEFRQHSGTIEAEKIMSWCKLIRTIVNWSITDRVENGTGSTTETTPENPFRNGSRVGVQYSLMRNGGATTREIMDATGCSEQRVRAAVSEIRNRVGHSAVVTNTMQANGARYGQGTDHTSYEVLTEITVENSGTIMIPENRIGNASIWSNVDDNDFEYWQNRTTDLYPNYPPPAAGPAGRGPAPPPPPGAFFRLARGGPAPPPRPGGGGAVPLPRQTDIYGQPHMLAYINPTEASLLEGLGGMGTPGPGGVPQYNFFSDFFSAITGGKSSNTGGRNKPRGSSSSLFTVLYTA